MTYVCETCERTHGGLPDIAVPVPDAYSLIPEQERADRTRLGQDLCMIRYPTQVDYYIRGVILIPILGADDALGFGAWLTQSRANFERYVQNEPMEPTVGLIGTRFKHQAHVNVSLMARAHFSADGTRPVFELDPDNDHPLSLDQRTGITLARAWEIVHICLPTWS